MSARTVPRPRRGEYRGSSGIDVAATLDPVVGVDGRVLIIGIITHVQGRRLVDDSSHQELRDIRLRCFPATCPVAVIMPVLETGFLLARHRVNGFQSNHVYVLSRYCRCNGNKLYVRGGMHDFAQARVLVRQCDLEADVRRHIGVVGIRPDPTVWVVLVDLT